MVLVVAAACSSNGGTIDAADIDALPEATASDIEALLADSERPVVMNVWASWCIPCRSEAPLLAQAHTSFGDDIRFVGIDVRDSQSNAREFLAEFDLDIFEHYFDSTGVIPGAFGGRGVPLTFFFRQGGELSYLHFGVIDERTLAVHLDELTR
ncbi:MAG: TlpA family protein disulfide reductase [Acidimicrobiia bacterium]|nr:TlpA family protein disulfide reductase [Acidimicrobiia bacterium]